METENTRMNTLELYRRILQKKNEDPSFDIKKAVTLLSERMAQELIIDQTSPLLNASVFVIGFREHLYAGHIYRLQHIDLDLRKHPGEMSPFDAAVLVRCLAALVSEGQIRNNVIYDSWFESFGTCGTNPLVNAQRAFYLVQMTDRYLNDYEQRRQPQKKNIPVMDDEEVQNAVKEKTEPEQNVSSMMDAEEKAAKIIGEAEEQAKVIIEQAQREASVIREKAQNVFDGRSMEADQRVKQMKASINLESFETKQKEINDTLKEIRRMVNETGASLNQLDQKINDEMIMKVFDQYYELYNLIADVADSLKKDLNEDSLSVTRMCRNHQIYLDIIEENLAGFGIDHLVTGAGEPFDGRIHESCGMQNFDPHSTKVKKSLRHGFCYGAKVLKKELVEVEEEQ